jgi:hypothetical protein
MRVDYLQSPVFICGNIEDRRQKGLYYVYIPGIAENKGGFQTRPYSSTATISHQASAAIHPDPIALSFSFPVSPYAFISK